MKKDETEIDFRKLFYLLSLLAKGKLFWLLSDLSKYPPFDMFLLPFSFHHTKREETLAEHILSETATFSGTHL